MQIIKTVRLEKTLKNGKIIGRWYDFVKNQQGFCIQRNGRTLTGRLSGYGGNQIFNDYVESDIENGWKREGFNYDHPESDKIVNDASIRISP